MAVQKLPAMVEGLSKREVEILRLLAEGMSDREIAERLVMTINTIKWYNRHIYGKLGVGSRTQAITRARHVGLLDNLALPQTVPSHFLPAQTTPFIGRKLEIAEVKRLLQTARLLTLTGTGGTGKTRLALRAASEVLEDFADGVYFVDLAPLSDAALVTNAIAAALGVTESVSQPLMESLKHRLRHQHLLLVLDNFEHVLSGAPLVSDLLAAAPDLKVLVTSREALHLYGEQEYFVPSLTLPEPTLSQSPSELAQYESVALFVQQARAVKPGFELKQENALEVAQICVRLDGLPLAIELSAARIKLLTPQALLARLSSRLDALTGGARNLPARQQTLRNTIEWSYNLLDEGEKTLFARLAVFQGGCSLEAIEAVCGADLPMDGFDGLASLVDKSLVQQKATTDGEPRFVLLEMIREYAWERLEASGEAEALRKRHALYVVELAERGEPELRLARYDYWSQRFELELDNIRAVLDWTLGTGDVALGIRLAGALGLFWYGKGYHVEGIRWTQHLLERLDEAPVMYHPQFLISVGHMTFLHDLDAARRLFVRALDISREIGSTIQMAWALILLAYTMQRKPEEAMPVVEEGLALFRELNHQPGIAQALNIIGEIARVSGDDDRARQAYEECLSVCQQTGEARRICYMCFGLSHIAQHERNHEHAMDLARRGLRLAHARKDTNEMADGVAVVAGSFSLLGQAQRAACLLGASEAAAERLGAFHHPSDRPEIERIIADVRAQLDPAVFEAAWAEGRAMTLERAVALALEE
jgi:predicted ATPase/DNA-binding CsgD family transcriptional regulator